MRKVINLDDDWKFYKGEWDESIKLAAENTLSEWETINLPHTWNAYDGQDGGNDYYQGISWYQKRFTMDKEWKEVFIRFGAVSKMAEIWCNGKYVGEHRGGFSAFTFELSPYLQNGRNEIFVKVNNSRELPIYPMQADFTFFGGIYRGVELICFEDNSHFDVAAYGIDAVFVTPEESGRVTVDTFAIGGRSVAVQIIDRNGNCVAASKNNNCGNSHLVGKKVELILEVEKPLFWNGTKNPNLYQLKVYLEDADGRIFDEVDTYFGFRNYSVTADKGFFLNGVSYPLRGVCRHQDRENMGWAITEKEHLEDMALIREIGANTIRLAHYQQAPFFYDLCDRNGMVVWAEIPFISVHDEREEADQNLKQQMQELILQNYNHPSICFWGIANEVGIGGESEKMYQILRELNDLTKKLDPSRLTVIANVGMTKTSSPLFHITDVTSYNEYKGWYEGTMEDHGIFCDQRHEEIQNIPLAISEYGAESILSWHSEEPKIKDYSEEYQALLHETAENDFEKRSYIWATWLWNMFDFAADARDEGGCKGRNNKGLVTFDRKVKKQAFFYYKACWSQEPFVYLCGKRFTKHACEKTNIKVYTNQKHVDLWVNGIHVGEQDGKTVFEFKGVMLPQRFNEILVRTEDGFVDTLILEKVSQVPEEYVLKEEKNLSEAVTQWFVSLQKTSENEVVHEIIVNEGCLSVYDSMEEIYRYSKGFAAVQELVAKPLAINDPLMASRMDKGGAMNFVSIWNHIRKQLPDEVIYLLNERLNKIPK